MLLILFLFCNSFIFSMNNRSLTQDYSVPDYRIRMYGDWATAQTRSRSSAMMPTQELRNLGAIVMWDNDIASQDTINRETQHLVNTLKIDDFKIISFNGFTCLLQNNLSNISLEDRFALMKKQTEQLINQYQHAIEKDQISKINAQNQEHERRLLEQKQLQARQFCASIEHQQQINRDQQSYRDQEALKSIDCGLADATGISMQHNGTTLPQKNLFYPEYDRGMPQHAPEIIGLQREIQRIRSRAYTPSQTGLRSWTRNPFAVPSLSNDNFEAPKLPFISLKTHKIEEILRIVVANDQQLQSLQGTDQFIDNFLTPLSGSMRVEVLLPQLYKQSVDYFSCNRGGYFEGHKQFLLSAPSQAIRDHSENLKLQREALKLLIKETHALFNKILKNPPFDFKQFYHDIKSGNINPTTLEASQKIAEYMRWKVNLLHARQIIGNAQNELEYNYECQKLNRDAIQKNNNDSIKAAKKVANKIVPVLAVAKGLSDIVTTTQQRGQAEWQDVQNFQHPIAQNTAVLDQAMQPVIQPLIDKRNKIVAQSNEQFIKQLLSQPSWGISNDTIAQRMVAWETTIAPDATIREPDSVINVQPITFEQLGLSIKDVAVLPGTAIQNQLFKENTQLLNSVAEAYKVATDPQTQQILRTMALISKNAIEASRRGDIAQATELTNRASTYAHAIYLVASNNLTAKNIAIVVSTVAGAALAPEIAPFFAAHAVGTGLIKLSAPIAVEIGQRIGASALLGTRFISPEKAHEEAKEYVRNLLGDQTRLDGDLASEPAQDIVEQKQKVKNLRPHEQREVGAAAAANGLPPSPPRQRNRYENINHNKNRIKNTEKQLYSAIEELKGKFETKQGTHSIYAVKADQITALTKSCGKEIAFISADHLHNEIEVWDKNGRHLGAIDPETKQFIKRAMPDPQRNF